MAAAHQKQSAIAEAAMAATSRVAQAREEEKRAEAARDIALSQETAAKRVRDHVEAKQPRFTTSGRHFKVRKPK